MTPEEAVAVVARWALADAADELDWQNYAEVGLHDWERVLSAARELVSRPSPSTYQDAYALLIERADR